MLSTWGTSFQWLELSEDQRLALSERCPRSLGYSIPPWMVLWYLRVSWKTKSDDSKEPSLVSLSLNTPLQHQPEF